ncbi:MAG: DNA cytosine methyltransferase [Candidatus Pacebacteria bacterium]|nr:DNA cytosine methyltransferase [Candidatus Paceibacterota bacterium]
MTPAHPCPSAPLRFLPGAANSPGVSAPGAFPKLRVLDLFSGIGGFSLGLERTGGFETVAFCEIEPFPRRVLAKHWPGVPCYDDVRTLTADVLRRDGIAVDVITGGFPCQDLSVAGKQRGMGEGTRSGLWSEIVRLVGELRPQYVIVENVAALLAGPSERRGGWFGRVLGDLAECGYDAEWENIPASALGAPHRRERVWLCAYPSEDRDQEQHIALGRARPTAQEGAWQPDQLHSMAGSRQADVPHTHSNDAQRQQPSSFDAEGWSGQITGSPGSLPAILGRFWRLEPDVGRVAHGVPDRSHRLAALGNSVVPQIPELIGRAILQARQAQ